MIQLAYRPVAMSNNPIKTWQLSDKNLTILIGHVSVQPKAG